MREKAQLVKEFCNANPTPVQDICPEINQYFKTSKGYEIWNSRTHIRETIDFNPTSWQALQIHNLRNTATPRKEYEGFYIRYIEELDALEMARVWLKGNRGQNGEDRKWTYKNEFYYSYSQDRFFLFHEDSNAYLYDGTVQPGSRYYSRFVISTMSEWMSRSFVCMKNYEELKKFAPKVNLDLNYWGYSDSKHTPQIWEYREWYRKDFMKRKVSQKAKNILDYDLNEKVEIKKATYKPKAILFQQLDDNYVVLRCYDYSSRWDVEKRTYVMDKDAKGEIARLFIPTKGNPTLICKEFDKWKIKSSTFWRVKGETEIINLEDMKNSTRLKYILPCIDVENCTLQSFINILRHPIVEQIYKAGYPNIAKAICYDDTICANLKETFGIEKEKKLPMFKLLGVNKFVMNAAEKSSNHCLSTIRELKFFAGDFDTTKLNEETCEIISDYINCDNSEWRFNSLRDIVLADNTNYWGWRRRYDEPLTDEEKKWIIRLLKMEKKHEGCIRLYRDVISTYRQITNKPDINLYNVRNYSEIGRLHDALVNLQIQEEADRRRAYNERERKREEEMKKKFEKLQEDRITRFEYENENYCIKVPHELSEITKEGLSLHHCVGSYLDRHANGYTNIIFLRRKEDEDTPFYTIEIDNDNEVIQIHGYGNRWLGNDPDAVPFVYTYLNRIGAKYTKKLLLNKGTGYCASEDNLDDSYLKNIA